MQQFCHNFNVFCKKHLKMAERLFDDHSAKEIKKKKPITLHLYICYK